MTDQTHNFTVEENKRFWDSNQSTYFGSKHADSIYFLCKNYIGKAVLDAGAGDGSMMRALKKLVPTANIRAVDLAPKSDDVEQGDLSNLTYNDNSFDTVLFMEVIEHLPQSDIDNILKELKRVLRPEGHLILTTPYKENLTQAQVCCPKCETVFHRYGHQQSFSENDIASLFSKTGLSPAEITVIKMNRIKRLKFLGAALLKSEFMQRQSRNARGQRNLICIGRK